MRKKSPTPAKVQFDFEAVKNLSEQEKEFAKLYAKSGNSVEAYALAFGEYDAFRRLTQAAELMKRVDVQMAIDYMRMQALVKTENSFNTILDEIRAHVNKAASSDDMAAAFAGWDKVLKMLGYYVQQQNNVGSTTVNIKNQQNNTSSIDFSALREAGADAIRSTVAALKEQKEKT